MSVPGPIGLTAELAKVRSGLLVGAGTVLKPSTAKQCLAAGASFIVSPGSNLPTVDLVVRKRVRMMAGALTPSEVMAA
jgi:2-dehydro-3-deoxyphosphogluconate aldolase/(4S)-4-hydroxy-2-oxoglutarate aldolase